jgi:hypothetical protein
VLLGAVLAVTAVATYLYGRRTGAGRPPEDRNNQPDRTDIQGEPSS